MNYCHRLGRRRSARIELKSQALGDIERICSGWLRGTVVSWIPRLIEIEGCVLAWMCAALGYSPVSWLAGLVPTKLQQAPSLVLFITGSITASALTLLTLIRWVMMVWTEARGNASDNHLPIWIRADFLSSSLWKNSIYRWSFLASLFIPFGTIVLVPS